MSTSCVICKSAVIPEMLDEGKCSHCRNLFPSVEIVNIECCLCGHVESANAEKGERAEQRHARVCKNANPDGYSAFDFCSSAVEVR